MKKLFGIFLIVLFFSINNANAYDFIITGYVKNISDSLPVQNQEVTFFLENQNATFSTKTNIDGYFSYKFSFHEGETEQIVIKTICEYNGETNIYTKTELSLSGFNRVFFYVKTNPPTTILTPNFEYTTNKFREVRFTNTSEGEILKYEWNFNNRSTSNIKNPIFCYEKDGTYNVELVIYGENKIERISKQIKIIGVNKIEGYAYMGGNKIKDGHVYAIKKDKSFTNIKECKINDGRFDFTELPSSKYLFYIIPNINFEFNYFPKYLPAYSNQTLNWQKTENILLEKNSIFTFDLPSYNEIYYGQGVIEGSLKRSNPKTIQKIPEVIILYNKNKEAIDFRVPSLTSGKYKFDKLPYGTYYIHVEKVGISSALYKIIISEDKISKINIEVSDKKINFNKDNEDKPSLKNNNINIDIISAYKKSKLIINSSIKKQIVCELYDITGKLVYLSEQTPPNLTINVQNLSSGIYMLRINTFDNKYITTKKIFIDN